MYETLTVYMNKLKYDYYGKWHCGENEFPFVNYTLTVHRFEDAVYEFVDEHKEMGLQRYYSILENNNIEYTAEKMREADECKLNGQTLMALIVGAIRAERLCTGALLGFLEDGCIIKWLTRLEEIDKSGNSNDKSV